jgi:hypothetical protein
LLKNNTWIEVWEIVDLPRHPKMFAPNQHHNPIKEDEKNDRVKKEEDSKQLKYREQINHQI